MTKYRIESDSIGDIKVNIDNHWGAQTQRSLKNFKIGKEQIPDELIKSLAIVKKAAASANLKLKNLEKDIAEQIINAASMSIDGHYMKEFPFIVWQTGSGTQTNLNMNEVIASIANETLTGNKGGKSPVHPNDHVNKGQSSNDVFPTAMHIAIAVLAISKLLPSLK